MSNIKPFRLTPAGFSIAFGFFTADLRVGTPPEWIIELAEQVKLIEPGAMLPTGVIVGSAVIEKVVEVVSGQLSVGRRGIRLYWQLQTRN